MSRAAGISLVLGFAALHGQTRLEFEAASVRPSRPDTTAMDYRGGPGTDDPGLFTCENMSLASLVTNAYGIYAYQLSAPPWMFTTRFDIRARVSQGATKDQFAIMLRNLLADRFNLAIRHEFRDMQTYSLVVARNGPKFKRYTPPPVDPDSAPKASVTAKDGRTHLYWPGMPMQKLASQVAVELHRPVIDATGLDGVYEISLEWSPAADGIAPAPESGPTLEQALQDQLGLRLEAKKGPVDFLVVEHAVRVPAEN